MTVDQRKADQEAPSGRELASACETEGECVPVKITVNLYLRILLPSLVACDIRHTFSRRKAIVNRHLSVNPDKRRKPTFIFLNFAFCVLHLS